MILCNQLKPITISPPSPSLFTLCRQITFNLLLIILKRLGTDPSSSSEAVGGGAAEDEEAEPRRFVLKMWQDGFSVDDGDLRQYDDPANRLANPALHHADNIPHPCYAVERSWPA